MNTSFQISTYLPQLQAGLQSGCIFLAGIIKHFSIRAAQGPVVPAGTPPIMFFGQEENMILVYSMGQPIVVGFHIPWRILIPCK
jgi:hypothetical protein